MYYRRNEFLDKMLLYFTSEQHSTPKAIMAYANDAVFKDEFSCQTGRVTAAFKNGIINVATFMDTLMLELTKLKDENLFQQQLANQVEEHEILCNRRQETLSLACQLAWATHRKRCSRYRDSADLQP